MRRFFHATVLLLFALVAAACSSTQISIEHAPGVRFENIKTYAWRAPASGTTDIAIAGADAVDAQWYADKTRAAIESTLAQHGLVLVPADAADVFVTHHLSLTEELRMSDPYYSYSDIEEYEEGTLVVDIVDAEKRVLIWRGVAHKQLDNTASLSKREKNIERVVTKLFDEYPPE